MLQARRGAVAQLVKRCNQPTDWAYLPEVSSIPGRGIGVRKNTSYATWCHLRYTRFSSRRKKKKKNMLQALAVPLELMWLCVST